MVCLHLNDAVILNVGRRIPRGLCYISKGLPKLNCQGV